MSPTPQASREVFARLAAAAAVAAGVVHVSSCSTASGPVAFDGAAGPPDDGSLMGFEDASGIFFYGSPGVIGSPSFKCTTSAGCLPGQVCCGETNFTSSCQAGPCPATPLGPLQLCGISAECLVPGDTCGPPPPSIPVSMLGVMLMTCNAPSAAGNTEAGISDAASTGEGGSVGDGGDTGASHAAAGDTGGEAGPSDASTGD